MALKLVALALTAIAFAPGAAHLFELPAKIDLGQDDYLLVQGIYAGWALFAVPIFAAIAANMALFVKLRRLDPTAARSAFLASALIAISLIIFFIWVFPANQATENWTTMPANWDELRRNWEYGHAVNALIMFVALLATGRAIATTDRVAS
ncbi:MAG: DUF1772 domain-containing protein [Rhizobiaceae bacterium]|nr:DUF1772 domain-containing protein [Rhizobiaceae bacterium]MCV0408664.1 DUF1772 domain-containing protein [Rhizobiaceae bacterium]